MRWKVLWLITTVVVTNTLSQAETFHKIETDQHNENNSTIHNGNEIETRKSDLNSSSELKSHAKSDKTETDLDNTSSKDVNKHLKTSQFATLLRSAGKVTKSIFSHSNNQNNIELINEHLTNERFHRTAEENSEEKSGEGIDIDHVVNTDLGKVQGHVWANSDDIISYLDIPYGNFTLFQAPIRANEWNDTVHFITEHTKRCPQMYENVLIGDSDCLTLSIFAPKTANDTSVLFYIHESNSNTGSGDPNVYGPEYLVKKGIILVLPNYRLGALGFLCLRNSIAPGNAALKDLALALEWTKNNIKAFGGDPSNIVISGDGTSGALAGYLALSAESRNHISKVITESGAVLSHWAIDRDPISTADQVAENVRIATGKETSNDIFNDIDIDLLITTTYNFTLKPCIEVDGKGVITKNPWATLKSEPTNTTFIIGSADHAALPKALQYNDGELSQLNETFEGALPDDLVFPDANTRRDVVQKIRELYFGSNDIESSATKNLSLYHTDASYLGPDIRLARALVAAGAKVYLYEFCFVGELNKELQIGDNALRHGAIRGDVARYLFSHKEHKPDQDSKEEKVIELMTNLWVSFMKTGKPTMEGVTWNEFNVTADVAEPWLSIEEEATSRTGFHYERLRLWTEVYRDYFIDNNAAKNIKAFGFVYYSAVLCIVRSYKHVI